jgi:hypothetical protein
MAPGIKTGGRKKGSKNKRKAVAELLKDATVQAVKEGETPLEYMLKVMRDRTQEYPRRDDMAKAAAPYVHSRLAVAEVKHTGEVTTAVRFIVESAPEIITIESQPVE